MTSAQSKPSQPVDSDNVSDFFHKLSQQKEGLPPPLSKSSRLITGAILGLLIGLIYGLVSQLINSLLMPTVPLALYPFGLLGNLFASLVVWTIIGTTCALPDAASAGVILGCMMAAIVPVFFSWATQLVTSGIYRFAVMAALSLLAIGLFTVLCIPLMLLLRWAIEVQGELAHRPLWSWRRLRAPLAMLIVVGIATGTIMLYPADVRQAMRNMQTLIQEGLAASHSLDLPPSLQIRQVDDFLNHATHEYTLEQSVDDKLFSDISSIGYGDILIVARFNNGWILACRWSTEQGPPRCKSYGLPQDAPNA